MFDPWPFGVLLETYGQACRCQPRAPALNLLRGMSRTSRFLLQEVFPWI